MLENARADEKGGKMKKPKLNPFFRAGAIIALNRLSRLVVTVLPVFVASFLDRFADINLSSLSIKQYILHIVVWMSAGFAIDKISEFFESR
jgi:hypothetical protein